MPGTRFDSPLKITAGKIAPTGPLDPTDGWPTGTTAKQVAAADGTMELYVWVVQQSAGGVGAFMGSPGACDIADPNTKWTTPAPGAIGQFQPGPALGMAVQIWKGPNAGDPTRVFWWTDAILLQSDDHPTP